MGDLRLYHMSDKAGTAKTAKVAGAIFLGLVVAVFGFLTIQAGWWTPKPKLPPPVVNSSDLPNIPPPGPVTPKAPPPPASQ